MGMNSLIIPYDPRMGDAARALAFLRHSYRIRAVQLEAREWGELVVTPTLPRIWDANFAIVDRWDGTPAELHAELEREQGAFGFPHRKTTILDEALGGRVWPALAEPDWTLSNRFVVMAHRRPPDRPADPAIRVEEVEPDAFGDVHEATSREQPWGEDAEVVAQLRALNERLASAIPTRPFAAIVDGAPAAAANLYQLGPVAQIEDVATVPTHRGKGLARAVVLAALGAARAEGAELVFLVADETDWPKELYGRLGFDTVAVEHMAGRPASV